MKRRGEKVDLRAQALRLLVLLVENRGRVVGHEEIRSAIWGERQADTAKAIPLLIREIREALGESASDPALVETVPREGYRFVGVLKNNKTPVLRRKQAAAVAAGLAVMVLAGVFLSSKNAGAYSKADAYYQKGAHLVQNGASGQWDDARDYFQKALKENQNHGLSLAGLAEIAVKEGDFVTAESLAGAAIERSDEARGHLVMAQISAMRDWNWEKAFFHNERALKRNSKLAEAWAMKAMLLTLSGDNLGAIAASETAYKLEPVSALIRIDHGWFHYYARDYENAMRLCSEALKLDPEFTAAAYCRLKAALYLHDTEQSLEAAQFISALWLKDSADGNEFKSMQDFFHWHRDVLKKELANGAPYWEALAAAQLQLGEYEEAMSLLRVAMRHKSQHLPLALLDPVFDPLRDRTDFTDLVRQALSSA